MGVGSGGTEVWRNSGSWDPHAEFEDFFVWEFCVPRSWSHEVGVVQDSVSYYLAFGRPFQSRLVLDMTGVFGHDDESSFVLPGGAYALDKKSLEEVLRLLPFLAFHQPNLRDHLLPGRCLPDAPVPQRLSQGGNQNPSDMQDRTVAIGQYQEVAALVDERSFMRIDFLGGEGIFQELSLWNFRGVNTHVSSEMLRIRDLEELEHK